MLVYVPKKLDLHIVTTENAVSSSVTGCTGSCAHNSREVSWGLGIRWIATTRWICLVRCWRFLFPCHGIWLVSCCIAPVELFHLHRDVGTHVDFLVTKLGPIHFQSTEVGLLVLPQVSGLWCFREKWLLPTAASAIAFCHVLGLFGTIVFWIKSDNPQVSFGSSLLSDLWVWLSQILDLWRPLICWV